MVQNMLLKEKILQDLKTVFGNHNVSWQTTVKVVSLCRFPHPTNHYIYIWVPKDVQ